MKKKQMKKQVRGLAVRINFRPTEFLGEDDAKRYNYINATARNEATGEMFCFRTIEQLRDKIGKWNVEKYRADKSREKQNLLLKGQVVKAEQNKEGKR